MMGRGMLGHPAKSLNRQPGKLIGTKKKDFEIFVSLSLLMLVAIIVASCW